MFPLPTLLLLTLIGCPSGSESGKDPVGDTGCPAAELGTWYRDADGDGYGDPDGAVEACSQPEGTVADATDCDDGAAAVYPGAEEIWYDGADEDCSGGGDFDQDGDGYDRDEECDDLDPARYPDPEVVEVWYDGVDDNCDGNDGDRDGDGYFLAGYPHEIPAGYAPGDCADDPGETLAALNGGDDLRAADVHPGVSDAPYDGIDADCDAADDFDADRDGFRTDALPDETGAYGDDCDDADSAVHPGGRDAWYDGVDGDCRGNDDFDQDYDGVTPDGGDCDDTDAGVHAGAVEACGDTIDQDCDGSLNGATMSGCTSYYEDADGDDVGLAETCACEPVGAYTVPVGGDCDDADQHAWPGAPELCDGRRNNCDDRSWTTSFETGAASWEEPGGAWADVTALVAGDPYTAAVVAPSGDGTLWLCQGTWYAQVWAAGGAEVRVYGRYGEASTGLSGTSSGTTLAAVDAGTTLSVEGLTITGGVGTYGGGLAASGATVEVAESTFSANEAEYGGGAFVEGGTLTLRDVVFTTNRAESSGGGLFTLDADVSVSSSSFLDNVVDGTGSGVGGGMAFVATGAQGLTMDSVELDGNSIAAGASDAQAGGLYLGSEGSGTFTLTSVMIADNEAAGESFAYGGGLRASIGGAVTFTATDLLVSGNVAVSAGPTYGGGLCLDHWGSGDWTMDLSTFEDNRARGDSPAGGGMFVVPTGSGDVELLASSVLSNGTSDTAGTTERGEGGGIYAYVASTSMVIDRSTVQGNAALNGDGIEYVGDLGADLQVLDSDVASNGGFGILYYGYDASSQLVLDGSRVYEHLYYGLYVMARSGHAATTTCRGDAATLAGLYLNDAHGLGETCATGGGTCTFVSEGCDFGDASTGNDNGAADLLIDGVVWLGYGNDAWFTCVDASCT